MNWNDIRFHASSVAAGGVNCLHPGGMNLDEKFFLSVEEAEE
jgi:hypothetical protein